VVTSQLQTNRFVRRTSLGPQKINARLRKVINKKTGHVRPLNKFGKGDGIMNFDPEETIATKFRLESVEETSPPAGMNTGKWYSYIIGRGSSMINGKMAGSLRAVTEHAESVVEDLNSRANRHGSIYVSRRQK
jgi:hypothetical protein